MAERERPSTGADPRRTAPMPAAAPLLAARALADVLPDLLVEASRVATDVTAGWHGRRRAGPGDAFWQFRPLFPGESTASIDWRRSARDDQLHVREREWSAAHTVWLAPDLSASMNWCSRLAPVAKRDRAVVLTLALAELLGRAGERVGVPGLTPPRSDRHAAERVALALVRPPAVALPDPGPIGRHDEVVVFADFLMPIAEIDERLARLAATGARLHLLRLVDPAEETLPFAGNVEFRDPETDTRLTVPRVESLAEDYRRRWRAHGDALADLARRRHMPLLVHHTDRPAAEVLLALHAGLGGERHGLAREHVQRERPA